jgi:hypothetical protein
MATHPLPAPDTSMCPGLDVPNVTVTLPGVTEPRRLDHPPQAVPGMPIHTITPMAYGVPPERRMDSLASRSRPRSALRGWHSTSYRPATS